MSAAWQNGTPPEATALYARWWQLETWLRSLVYVERSARDGRRWADSLPSRAEMLERADLRHGYMASPDAQARLAYLDAGPLLNDVITDDWELYADALIDKDAWKGRVVELRQIRHRIGHCRRPHQDDLARLEQTLRDIDAGAFRAVAAYNRGTKPDRRLDDPLVDAWVGGSHPDAARLLKHAQSNYDIQFHLRYSRRPWAEQRERDEPITTRSGYLWHAQFVGSRPVDIRKLWCDTGLDVAKELVVYMTANDPFAVEFSFAAVDNATEIADAIGSCFDAVLTHPYYHWDASLDASEQWLRRHGDLDARVQIATAWSIVDDSTKPITMFAA